MTRLDEIAARLAAATPPPWEAVAMGFNVSEDGVIIEPTGTEVHPFAHVLCSPGVLGGRRSARKIWADAALIAHAPTDLAYLLEHARQADAALAAVQAEAARLRAALAWYAYEADAVMMYDDSGARATAALTAPAPNAERGQALLLVAEAARDAWAAYNFDGIHGDLPRAMHGLGEALSHEEGTR